MIFENFQQEEYCQKQCFEQVNLVRGRKDRKYEKNYERDNDRKREEV